MPLSCTGVELSILCPGPDAAEFLISSTANPVDKSLLNLSSFPENNLLPVLCHLCLLTL